MTINSGIEQVFSALNDSAEIIQEHLDITYLEALIEASECLFQQDITLTVDEMTKKRLKNKLFTVKTEDLSPEDLRKTLQLTILKGMKNGVQSHHTMTPDAVALFLSYLVNKVMSKNEVEYSLLDPAIGSGNLVTAIINHSKQRVKAFGVEADDTLLRLAYVNSNLQQHQIELFHQDSIKPLYIDPVDIVVSDLPIGYYPNDQVARHFQLKADQGQSYVHHLMIEQAISYTKPGGYLLFLIPNNMFEDASKLHPYMKEHTVILSLLQLPVSLFKNETHAKSIFLLQKKGENVHTPRQALLAELPSFSKKSSLADMIKQIDSWFKSELGLG